MPGQTSLHSRVVALGALHMGFSMLSAAFGFYYVNVFLNVYHIEEYWFQVSHTFLLVWNTINDPMLAYWQDSTNFRCTRTRRESVLYAAPLFAFSFLVPWFPWGTPGSMIPWVTGIHLITALCFFDTMFTYIGLASACLFTELSTDSKARLKMVKYNQIGHLLGSSSVFVLQYMSQQLEHFQVFQTTCIVIAVISSLLLIYCGKHTYTELELRHENDVQSGKPRVMKSQEYSYLTLAKQILLKRDFLSFAIMNFFSGFHRIFLTNFFTIFADQLILNDAISPLVRSVFYGAGTASPRLIVIFGAGVVSQYGYYQVIRYSQIFMIIYGLLYYITGPINHWCIMVFMLIDSCASTSIHTIYSLALADIADKDSAHYNRRHPVTSMVYGCNSLVVKPAISLAPMIIVTILNVYGYDRLKQHTLSASQVETLSGVMFNMLCLIPFTIGCIQYYAWSFYTIREQQCLDLTVISRNEKIINNI